MCQFPLLAKPAQYCGEVHRSQASPKRNARVLLQFSNALRSISSRSSSITCPSLRAACPLLDGGGWLSDIPQPIKRRVGPFADMAASAIRCRDSHSQSLGGRRLS